MAIPGVLLPRLLPAWRHEHVAQMTMPVASAILYAETHVVQDRNGQEASPVDEQADMDAEQEWLFHQDFPQAAFHKERDCRLDSLIHDDLDLALNHIRCCLRHDPEAYHPEHREDREGLLRYLYRKVNRVCKEGALAYWHRDRRAGYDRRITLLIRSSTDWLEKRNLTLCGYRHPEKGWCASCHDTLFCDRCNHNDRREPVLIEFGNCFGADQEALFITLSLTADPDPTKQIVYKDLTKSEMEQIRKSGAEFTGRGLRFRDEHVAAEHLYYFRLFRRVIGKFIHKKKRLTGAFGAPEVALRFMPLEALYHVHLIAFTPGFCRDYAEQLHSMLCRAISRATNGQLPQKLHPSVAIYRIPDKGNYLRVVAYTFKHHRIELPYRMALQRVLDSGLDAEQRVSQLNDLNRQLDVAIAGLRLAHYSERAPYRYGVCYPSSPRYIGYTTPEKMKARETERKRRATRKEIERTVRSVMRKSFPGFDPRRKRRTEDQRIAMLRLRAEYEALARECGWDDVKFKLQKGRIILSKRATDGWQCERAADRSLKHNLRTKAGGPGKSSAIALPDLRAAFQSPGRAVIRRARSPTPPVTEAAGSPATLDATSRAVGANCTTTTATNINNSINNTSKGTTSTTGAAGLPMFEVFPELRRRLRVDVHRLLAMVMGVAEPSAKS